MLIENYEWFRKNLDVDTVFTLLTRGSPKEPLAKFFDVEKYEEYADHMEREYKSGSLSGLRPLPVRRLHQREADRAPQPDRQDRARQQVPDPVLRRESRRRMFANGDIYPCELLIDRKLGNVRDAGYDFKKIWFSEEAEEARHVHPRVEVLLHLRVLPHHQHPLQPPHDACGAEGVVEPEAAQGVAEALRPAAGTGHARHLRNERQPDRRRLDA